ncbi:hypothetical protein [Sphingobium sp. Sx8-8]|uniref:hypothetical protein n=1 Tax=Sphingobium sp. Sx8-8 TaxID=2933617 RepID=UPI001F5997E8|nr:hypothetical protein [Sphingobium sp. Sx8-8]
MNHPDYRALAAQARSEADASTLDNVRDRCLRSEAAFLAMAARQELADRSRARREAAAAGADPGAGMKNPAVLQTPQ